MVMRVLLALMKDGRDKACLMVIDYLIKENKTVRDKYTIRDGDRKYLPFDAMLPEGMDPVVFP